MTGNRQKSGTEALSLNDEQRAAVEFRGGQALVLAGAGTGKTRTIIARAAFLVGEGVDPARILAMTFTRRAARELTSRLDALVGRAAKKVVAGTFHHFCLFTMRRMAKRFGVESTIVIDRDDQTQLMKLARGEVLERKEKFPTASELVSLYSYARNTLRPVRAHLEKYTDYDSKTVDKMLRVFEGYENRKRRHRYLDYDDILHRFVRVLRDRPEVRDRLRVLYDHILVDEMQDTNPLQWQILDYLRDPALLFCVGDDAQSIYAFRGADFQNVHSFVDRVPGATVFQLEENYRSTQEILDVANWLLSESPLDFNRMLRGHRGAGRTPRLVDFESDLEEAGWIGDDLLERHSEGAEWGDHMIVTRTAWGARAVETALIERQIPYEFIGGMSLLQSAHVKDLLSLLRCMISPRDELAWIRYLTLWPRIGDVTAQALIAEVSEASEVPGAIERLRSSSKGRAEIVAPLEQVLKAWESPEVAVYVAGMYLEPILENRYDHWEARKKDFALLVRIAERHPSVLHFLETYTLDPVSASTIERAEGEDKVTLITVHSAKGTEAPVCYLIRAEPGIYPHSRSLGDKDQEEEERRVLYVAMTRAEDELIITRSHSFGGRMAFFGDISGGYAGYGTPYLLADLPDELVEAEVVGFSPLDDDVW
jgi:DNA helicase II / ATP-dependent DNA helicase PcrA